MANEPTAAEALDASLLEGAEFSCRPDCGLCCYATPAVDPSERRALIQIRPESEFLRDDRGEAYIAARPAGGACQFLSRQKCTVHAARPFPCAVFPVIVHAGSRFQASAVLSCPGVTMGILRAPAAAPEPRPSPSGLTAEIERAEARCRSPLALQALAGARRDARRIERRLEREGRWNATEEVRRGLRSRIPFPESSDFPVEDPPEVTEGEEALPLYFDHRAGPVAIAGHAGGWELVELREEGGVAQWLGVWPPPTRMPGLEPAGAALLRAYLAYWLERDALFGFVHLAMLEEPSTRTVIESVAAELRWIGATVVARARIRASAAGRIGPTLAEVDIERGIRATDADLLDRAGWTVQL